MSNLQQRANEKLTQEFHSMELRELKYENLCAEILLSVSSTPSYGFDLLIYICSDKKVEE